MPQVAVASPPGLEYFDALKSRNGFKEYVPSDGFLGEYVNKLEQQAKSSEGSGNDSTSLEQPSTPVNTSRLPRWKRRTAEQVEANKLAQKRYRERKKTKLQQASAKVDNLTQQTQDFNTLESEVRTKNAENVDLEAQLLSLEAELARIRVELDAKTPQGKFDATSKLSRVLGPSTIEAKTESISDKWRKAKEKLDKLLEMEGLKTGVARTVSPTVDAKLQKRCAAMSQQCMEMLAIGGPALDDLLRTLPGNTNDLLREEEIGLYTKIAQSIALTPDQVDKMTSLLPSVTQRLERIYAERQALNKQVVDLLMLQPGNVPPDQPERLRRALNQLQNNLAEEQRLESEHHWVIMREVLTCLQGAWFMEMAYPRHCDTLAFMQAVSRLGK